MYSVFSGSQMWMAIVSSSFQLVWSSVLHVILEKVLRDAFLYDVLYRQYGRKQRKIWWKGDMVKQFPVMTISEKVLCNS
jgi:hypothetical protein